LFLNYKTAMDDSRIELLEYLMETIIQATPLENCRLNRVSVQMRPC
jgi:hypothetical protein